MPEFDCDTVQVFAMHDVREKGQLVDRKGNKNPCQGFLQQNFSPKSIQTSVHTLTLYQGSIRAKTPYLKACGDELRNFT